MKYNLKEHLQFTFEMFTLLGVLSLIFGIILIIISPSSSHRVFYMGVFSIFYSYLLFIINFGFYNLKEEIFKFIPGGV